ncbi:unnamed protein product [Orchesella dallaii]|uniref:3'-5' exonuclease domain-containing protein n=1 Tax=Orchesella dallaii TaxID=48710 RepID=A0ABP1QZE2_9HEXA
MAYRVLNSKQKKSAIWHQKKSQSNADFGKAPRPFDTPGYHVFRNERRKRIDEPYEVKERHPFIPDIQSWYLPRDKMIPPHEPFNMNDIMRREIGGKVWVDNKMTFDVMLQTLMSCKRHITHDLEMAYERSYDGNLVALLQFSTGMEHFLVDVFPLWNQIPRLQELMEDPEKVKVMHGCTNDLMVWQKYWNIYPINVVDTQLLYKAINKGDPIGLDKFLNETVPGANMKKGFQSADFCLRELPKELQEYALDDVRLLWYAFENYKLQVQNCCDEDVFEIQVLMKRLMMKTYASPRKSVYDTIDINLVGTDNESLFFELYEWRDEIAKRNDVHPTSVMKDESMNGIASTSIIPESGPKPYRFVSGTDILELLTKVFNFAKAHSIKNGIKIPSSTQTAVVQPRVRSEVRRVYAQIAVADTVSKRTVEVGTENQFKRKYAEIQSFDQELVESEKLLEKIDEMMDTEENEKVALQETFSRDFDVLNSQMEMEKEPGELEDMDTYDANANTEHHDTTTTNQEENPAEYGENNEDVLVIGISDKDKLDDNLDFNYESNYVKVHTATMQTFFVKDVTNNPNVSVKERYRLVMKNVCMKCICKDTGHIGRNCPFKHLDDRSPEVQGMIANNKRMLHTTNPFIKEHEARRHSDRHQRAKVLKGKSVN